MPARHCLESLVDRLTACDTLAEYLQLVSVKVVQHCLLVDVQRCLPSFQRHGDEFANTPLIALRVPLLDALFVDLLR